MDDIKFQVGREIIMQFNRRHALLGAAALGALGIAIPWQRSPRHRRNVAPIRRAFCASVTAIWK